MSKINDIIEFSVGGQMFKTKRSTLVSEPNSLLADMFEFTDNSANVEAKNEETGASFIDRDPKYFSVVLNYLRNRKVEMNKDIDHNYLMEEAKFYGIQGMVDILEKDQQEKKVQENEEKRKQNAAREFYERKNRQFDILEQQQRQKEAQEYEEKRKEGRKLRKVREAFEETFEDLCYSKLWESVQTGNPQLDFQIAQAFQLKKIAEELSSIRIKK